MILGDVYRRPTEYRWLLAMLRDGPPQSNGMDHRSRSDRGLDMALSEYPGSVL